MAHKKSKVFVSGSFLIDKSMEGKKITDIKTVLELAKQGKCVAYRGGRTPASFIQNFQARYLQNELDRGVVFHYKPKILSEKQVTIE